ncbi:hypothetical protein D3C72_1512880 [compost metagenome]
MVDREQHIVHGAVDAPGTVVGFPATGGDHQHRPLAGHGAFAIAVAPADVGMLSHAVGEAIGIDTLHPALEDRRHREPPEGKLQDQRIGPTQLVLLPGDVRALPAVGERPLGVQGRVEARSGLVVQAVAGIERGFPVHRIQVRDLDGVAGRFEALDREILQRAIERGGFGVGVDDQYVHGKPPLQDGRRMDFLQVYWK